MKRLFISMAALLLLVGVCSADAVVDFQDFGTAGYRIVNVTFTGTGADMEVDLSDTTNSAGQTGIDVALRLRGYVLYEVRTFPAAAPAVPDAYSGAVVDASVADAEDVVLVIPTRSTTEPERVLSFETLGQRPYVTGNVKLTCTDIGEDNITRWRLLFVK